MIVILKDADFSNSNIGQIEIPVDQYSELSLKIFEVYNTYNFSDSDKYAVEMFVRNLTKNGLLIKVKFLSFPVFATTLEQVNTNLIDGGYTIANAAIADYYKINEGLGLARSNPSSNGTGQMRINQPSSSDMHAMFFNTTIFPNGVSENSTEYFKNFGGLNMDGENLCSLSRSWTPTVGESTTAPILITGNSHQIHGDINFGNVVGALLMSSRNGDVFMVYNGQTAIHQDYGYVGSMYTDSNAHTIGIPCSPYNDVNNNFGSLSYGAISTGLSFTESEAQKYELLLQSLFDSLN